MTSQARVVNMPGMDDEPATTFSNLSVLFSKLGISEEGVDGKEEGENGEEGGGGIKWREVETEELKRALETPPKSPPTSKSWRDMDKPVSPTDSVSGTSDSYCILTNIGGECFVHCSEVSPFFRGRYCMYIECFDHCMEVIQSLDCPLLEVAWSSMKCAFLCCRFKPPIYQLSCPGSSVGRSALLVKRAECDAFESHIGQLFFPFPGVVPGLVTSLSFMCEIRKHSFFVPHAAWTHHMHHKIIVVLSPQPPYFNHTHS